MAPYACRLTRLIVQIKNTTLSLHTKWEKMFQLVNRRHQALEENRRRAVNFGEKLADLNYFILEKTNQIETDRSNLDPRQCKQMLGKHQKTEEEIRNTEKLFDHGKRVIVIIC